MNSVPIVDTRVLAMGDEPLLRVSSNRPHRKARRGSPQVQADFDRKNFQSMATELWLHLAEGEPLPGIARLNAKMRARFRVHSMLVSLPTTNAAPAVRHLGLSLAKLGGIEGAIETIADIPHGSVLAHVPDYFSKVLETRAPVRFDSRVVEGREGAATFNGVLLPFADDAGRLAYIYAVISEDCLDLDDHEIVFELDDSLMVEAGDVLLLEPDQELELAAASAPHPPATADAGALSDLLDEARNLAETARLAETRSRKALYQAISQSYDFSIAAAQAPEEFLCLLATAGITMQERAPMTPVVKLIFGVDHDRTRIAEYASVLACARDMGMGEGELASYLLNTEGGIKGVIERARLARRGDGGDAEGAARTLRPAVARKLRELEGHPVYSIPSHGSEFGLVMVRRLPDGEVVLLGEIADDPALLERASRTLLR